MSAGMLPEILVWFEDPKTLPFVRVRMERAGCRGRYPKSRMRGPNYRVVGFRDRARGRLRLSERHYEMRDVYTVRDYDKAPCDGGYVPVEGRDPLNLDAGWSCHEGSFPKVTR
jgi:hypothetical protein